MFVDQAHIHVKAGDGGNGMVAFRKEKYVPKGGPAGGDGGRGADVVFQVDEGLRTLVDFRYKRKFKANDGENGMSKSMHGRGANDLVISVPPGTVIKNKDTGEVIADLVANEEKAIIAKGGRGGRGNKRFATPANPAPEISENGEPGQERNVQLELKVLADVGLVGFPSVGKSTLLSVVSAARPKIATYHFTTVTPNLGVVETEDGRSFVMADLPGLIEGASHGVGLGHQFLRHIERTRVIVHLVDISESEGRDAYEDFTAINKELEAYNLRLMERPQIVVANKMDLPGAEENLKKFKDKLSNNYPIYPVSAFAKKGISELLLKIADKLEVAPEFPLGDQLEEKDTVLYKHEKEIPDFTIARSPDGVFVLSGPKIERLFTMTNFERDASIQRFARQLRAMGIDEALRKKGAQDGDTVRLFNYEFEFID